MLKIENLSVSLAGSPVLRALSMEVHAGTTTAVVGRNGAGKTTLLRSIMGLVKPSSGVIHLDDENLTLAPAHGRTRVGIGYAPEDRVIFPTLSVEENLRLPCDVLGLTELVMQERLAHVLEVVPQLKPMLARSGAALSGGQGKMVALARALMVGKNLVLLDEPFQGLAPALALQYAEALSRLRQSRPDLAVIITESNAALLTDIPNQILTIERGSFVEAHTH
jgi:ABC-type branched-subunit amino acid transport system ATPase component